MGGLLCSLRILGPRKARKQASEIPCYSCMTSVPLVLAAAALRRADSIVRDAELVRKVLVPLKGRWSILGQSFGGFCCLSYLSLAPEGLAEVLITGGLPPGISMPCRCVCLCVSLGCAGGGCAEHGGSTLACSHPAPPMCAVLNQRTATSSSASCGKIQSSTSASRAMWSVSRCMWGTACSYLGRMFASCFLHGMRACISVVCVRAHD
jgi:hypothetical protein